MVLAIQFSLLHILTLTIAKGILDPCITVRLGISIHQIQRFPILPETGAGNLFQQNPIRPLARPRIYIRIHIRPYHFCSHSMLPVGSHMARGGSNFPRKVQMPKSKAASGSWIDRGKSKRGHRHLRCLPSCTSSIPLEDNKTSTVRPPGRVRFGITVRALFACVKSILTSQLLTEAYSVSVAGTVRAVYQALTMLGGIDKPALSYNTFAAGIAECNAAIICASAPSLKSFLGGYFRDHFSQSGSSNAKSVTGSSSFSAIDAIKRSKSDSNNIVLVERSVEVKNSRRDDPELSPWPMEHAYPHSTKDKDYDKSFRQSTSRTTEISGGSSDDSPPRAESRWGTKEKRAEPVFQFFPDTDEDEIELMHSPPRTQGYL
jgi:hypothetical protein